MLFKALIFLFFISFPSFSYPFLVVELTLGEITRLADQVFEGRCIDLQTGEDSNGRPVQYITFEVTRTLKGEPLEQVTFKQIRLEERQEGGFVTGTVLETSLPTFKIREEAILFLSAPGRTGLTTTIGLSQGKFLIERDPSGRKWVTNGQEKGHVLNASQSPFLGSSLKASSRERKEIEYELFLQTVEGLLR